MYRCILKNRTYLFPDLKTLLGKASPHRSGDVLAGTAARSAEERVAAQMALSDLPLEVIIQNPLIPYESDEVSRVICDSWDSEAFRNISHHTVGSFRDFLLSDQADAQFFSRIMKAITPELASAVSKIMRNQDLILVASKIIVITKFRTTIGLPGRLSTRLQPNHPTDDPKGILASTIDGLYYASGDAVIGINPATDNLENVKRLNHLLDEFRVKYEIPTQTCILTHITNTIEAINAGVPVDLVFQSIGGTEKTNRSFGINYGILKEGFEAARQLSRGSIGNNVMYFETGQGSALSANGNEGVDQQTCEVRAYAIAREFEPLLVNTVVGFIGPEYLYNGKEIIRAGLEDHFCGKLMGLPMGCDICYTNHADADQDDMDILLTLLGAAGCNFIMGIPGADDIMLNYQSTSFHDALYLRKLLDKKPAPEFEEWLQKNSIYNSKQGLLPAPRKLRLASGFTVDPESIRTSESPLIQNQDSVYNPISRDPWRQLREYTDARIGIGRTGSSVPTQENLSFQLAHASAKDALFRNLSSIEFTNELSQVVGTSVPILRSQAKDLDTYLQRPDLGRILSEESLQELSNIYPSRIAIAITDGLSPLAIQENAIPLLRILVPKLIGDLGLSENELSFFYIERGRVGISDSLGEATDAELLILLVGERPGLSSPNSLGVYITYRPRVGMTDENRNCISNVRSDGLNYDLASEKILYLIKESLAKKITGVNLKDRSESSLMLSDKSSVHTRTRVKLCGLRDMEIASYSVAEGADYLGINFSPISKRKVTHEQGWELSKEIRRSCKNYSADTKIVLLFYKNDPQEILQISEMIQPDMIQLIHGDPNLPEDWTVFRDRFRLLPAFSVKEELGDDKIPFPPDEIPILDAPSDGVGGGTGESFPWDRLWNVRRKYLLAGGLSPENVERAIRSLSPWGVDVASGIEDEAGNQSRTKIREFIRNAKR